MNFRPPGGPLSRPLSVRRWLTPGIGIKRWFVVVFLGMLVLALGVAHVLRQATRDLEPGGATQAVLDAVTFQFLPYQLRGLIAGVAGLALIGIGAVQMIRAFTDPFRR
ncbi:MAG TPA: hypothetical protein VIM30_16955, partial [Candidatus Limnocylindrales bacterium]